METSSLKILAIDDNRDNLTTLKAVVSDRLPGARVLTALTGPQGLAMALAEDPDVVLLDIVMPGMDGYEVCRKLKADERLQAIPVVFLTALRTDLASRIAAMDAGAEGFLPKPFDEIELVAQIRAMAKIKAASRLRRRENEELTALVAERTRELERGLEQRARVEEALRASEAHYRSLFENSLDAILLTVPDGRILSANPTACRMFQMAEEELCARGRQGVVESGDPRLPLLLEERACNGRASGELMFLRKDGTRFPGEISSLLFKDASGALLSSMIIRDITEQKRLAAEKARLEDQLRQAQKVEAIGRLAGGVAHDFNNLTAIVLGYGEMLLSRLGPADPSRHWVEQIVAAGRRSATLTRQLLAFSRRQVLLPEVLDLNALLRDLEKLLGRLIGENIELEVNLAEGLGRITADPGQIEQVVTNLAVNARDAMPLGGRLVIETADAVLDATAAAGAESVVPGEYVLLSVTDTGGGMDRQTLERLFEPFFTTKPRGKGTGLGLATVHGIVNQSGGYVRVASEPGKGASFKIYLPRTDAEPKAKAAEASESVPRGSGERILLVEDEAALRELCETILSRLGYRVSVAENGLEALRLVQEQGFEADLVVSDVIMPDMGGAEMVERLRRTRPGLRVLYMSGYPDDAIAPHGVLAPGTPLLQKPFSERALAVKVRETLPGKAGAAPPARRVLMIDDDEQYRELVRHFCSRRGHVCAGVDTVAAALAALAGQSFDVLLLDMHLPGTSGESVLREIRAAGHTVPAIALSGDVSSADLAVLRPLGVLQALEKSGDGRTILQAIEEAAPR